MNNTYMINYDIIVPDLTFDFLHRLYMCAKKENENINVIVKKNDGIKFYFTDYFLSFTTEPGMYKKCKHYKKYLFRIEPKDFINTMENYLAKMLEENCFFACMVIWQGRYSFYFIKDSYYGN